MHSLVMSLCSCVLIVMSLVGKLIDAWFLDSELSTCFIVRYNVICIYVFHYRRIFQLELVNYQCQALKPLQHCPSYQLTLNNYYTNL